MKPGDLVQIRRPSDHPFNSPTHLSNHQGKMGLILSFRQGHEDIHPYYRVWKIMVEGKIVETQGMDLVVINESR